MWQDVIVFIIIVLATVNAVYQSTRLIAGKNNRECVGCPNCGIKSQLKRSN